MANPVSPKLPTRFGFLLLDDFTLISLSAAVETLRMANRLSGSTVYQWRTVSADGAPVCASVGLQINVDYGCQDEAVLGQFDAVIVCGGRRVERFATEPVLRWLRHCNKSSIGLGSTCTGSFVLAKAGLLDDYRCSIHWENYASLTVSFPRVRVSRSVYTIDRDRYTSSGGTAPIDMMLSFVRRQCGPQISAGVADQFIYERVRDPRDLQRAPLRHFVSGRSVKLINAVELMESNIREPINLAELASYVGLSQRQLQRLFQKYLVCTPTHYYVGLRLKRARELLHQTDLSLVEISAQAGFVSSSHFSRNYKEYFGCTPSSERRNAAT